MDTRDHEETKRASSMRMAFTQLDQVASDFALAIALQEQERALTNLFPHTIFQTSNDFESHSSEDDESEDEEDEDDGENSSNFFPSQEVEEGVEFLEGEGEEEMEEMEEEEEDDDDEIDPDELSYEELIALGEIVGEESRGLSMEEISNSLRPYKYHSLHTKTGVYADRCVICQIEYKEEEEEEKLVALPCEHPYHAECIIKWLQIKKTCPICGTEVSSFP